MKTKDEIQAKLDELLLEYDDVKDWHDKAYERYLKDRSYWGKDSDRSHIGHVGSQVGGTIKLCDYALEFRIKGLSAGGIRPCRVG